MADTIGRVEFIVGLDGKRLSAEARKAGAQLAKAGDRGGEDYGEAFGDSAGHEMDLSLNKAMQRLQKKFSSEGKLAGKTYANHLKDESVKIFRQMEKDTVKALASKEGFKAFAKNFDTVDDAVTQLTRNVKRLSKEKIQIFDEKGVALAGEFESFFQNFEAGPAMQQVDKWTRKIKESEQATKDYRDANEALRVNFDRLRASVDNVSFDKLAKNMGGAENAASRLRTKMDDLAEAGGVTEREYNRFNITLEKQVERYNALIKKQQDKIDADRDEALELARKERAAQALERALISIDNRMGDSRAFARYVKSVGDVGTANRILGRDIDLLGSRFGENDRTVARLRRTLMNLTEAVTDTASAGAQAASGGLAKLGDAIKKMASNKGGMSTGTIVVLIGSLGGAIAALGSAASAALVGLISSLGIAIVGLGAAAGTAGVGLIWMFTHATTAIGMMADEFPRAQKGMDELADAAKADSAAFARAWGPALADFTSKLAQLWRDDKMGERAGESLGKITEAFTAVISSPAYIQFQTAMETSIPNALTNLGQGAAALSEGLLIVFAEVGPILEDMMGKFEEWAQKWRDSMAAASADGSLATFLQLAEDSIVAVMDMLLSLGGLLGTVFTAGAPAGNEMLGMLTELFDSLNAFLKTPEGQTQLQEWFDNGVRLFDILLDLIGQIGGQFADMITPGIMDDSLNALSNLGDGLQVIFDIFQILGGLDVFGNIVAAFEALSAFVSPLVEPLYAIADAIGNLLLAAFEALTPILAAAGEVLAPFVEAIATIVAVVTESLIPVFEALSPAITAIVEAFIPVATLIADVVVKAFEILWPIIQIVIDFIVDLIEAITPLIEEALPLVSELVEGFSLVLDFLWPIIQQVAGVIMGILQVAFTIIIGVIKVVISIVEGLIKIWTDVVAYINDKLVPVFEEFSGYMDTVWGMIEDTISGAVDNITSFFQDIVDWIDDNLGPVFDDFLGKVKEVWDDIVDAIGDAIGEITGFFDGVKRKIDEAVGWFQSLFNSANKAKGKADEASASGRNLPAAASGMLLTFPRRVLAGEAGPEAIVPLRRPLSQVDPSVRALSAVAQGMSFAGSGIVGTGTSKVVNINPGAIVIQGDRAPEATATNVVNRVAQRIAG